MRRLLWVALVALAAQVGAQQPQPFATLAYRLEVDGIGAGNAEYPRMSNTWSSPENGPAGVLIKTTGASTTVEAVVASSAPFANVAVGDVIYTTAGVRSVTAKASNDSITVHASITLTNAQFQYRRLTITGGAAWWRADKYPEHTVYIEGTSVGGALTCFVECKSGAQEAGPTTVYPGSGTTCALATTGDDVVVFIPEPHGFCRVGIYNDASDNAQAISIFVQGGQ